ncbi:MAG: hypothetical protein ACYTG6_10615, partial [Planctomycetota bacterium]
MTLPVRSLLVLVATVTVASASARAEGRGASAVDEILAGLDAEPPVSVEETATRLSGLGPGAVPALLRAWWDDTGRTPPGTTRAYAEGPSCEALGRAIDGHGPAHVLPFLEGYARDHDDDPSRLRVLEAVARFGDKTMLPLAVAVAADLDEDWLRVPSVVRVWGAAAERALAGGWSPRTLLTVWEGLPAALRVPTCRVLVARGMQEDLLVVLELIARSEDDAAVLYEVLAGGSPVALHRLGIHPHVRRHLVHPDTTVRAAATTFLPRLGNA